MGKVVKGIGNAASSVVKGVGKLFTPTTKTVGVNPTQASTSNNYTNWLNQQLQGGQFKDVINNLLAGKPGDPTSLSQYFNAGMGGNGKANIDYANASFDPQQINVGYTPQDINAGYDPTQVSTQADLGSVNSQFDPTQFAANFNPQQIASLFQSPEFQQAILGNVNSNVNAQAAAPNIGGYQAANLQNVNTQFNPNSISSVAANVPQFAAPQLNSISLGNTGREQFVFDPNTGTQADVGNIVNPAANSHAIQSIMRRQSGRDIADLRERFGNQALGTGAQGAEALYRAEALPRAGLAIDDITRQNNAQALQQREQDISNFYGMRGLDANQVSALNNNLVTQRGQDIQQNTAAANVGLAGNQQAIDVANSQNQFGMQGAGLDLQAQQSNQGSQLAQLDAMLKAFGLSNDAILGQNAQNINASNNANQFNLSSAEINQQTALANLSAQLQAAGLNNEAILGQNAQSLQQSGQANQFNQGNSQFSAQQALQAALANQTAGQNAAGLNLSAAQAQEQSKQYGAAQSLQAALANLDANKFSAQYAQQGQQSNNQFAQAAAAQQIQAAIASEQNRQASSQMGIQAGQANNQAGLDAARLQQGNQQFNINAALQNQQMGNDWSKVLQSIGAQREGTQLSGQAAILQALFSGLGQTQALSTPKADTLVTPGAGTQWLDFLSKAAGSVTGALAGGAAV